MLEALIFDVDGTLADTEAAHLAAFNHAFAEFGLDWQWDTALYTRLLNISGGKERMLAYWREVQPGLLEVESMAMAENIARLHELKTAAYEGMVNAGVVSLRPGVLALLDEALAAGLPLAIATTTSPVNIAALLRHAMGANWRMNFVAIGDASTAPIKKPDPQVYLQMVAALNLPAAQCLAFEDSSNGLKAATAAGLATLITPTAFTDAHDFSNAMVVLPDLSAVDLAQLRRWHAEARPIRPAVSPAVQSATATKPKKP